MDCFSQEEDLPFFDANEEMASNGSNGDTFHFDVRYGCSESVVERRKKFLEWMGVDEGGRVSSGISASASNAEQEFDRFRENHSEAVMRSGDGAGEFSSSSQLSSFSSLSGSSMDLSGELSLRVDETRAYSSSMASSSDSRCCQGKESNDITGLIRSFKKGWFHRLRSMGCATGKEVESSTMKASSYGGEEVVSGGSHCRVKVKHCRKKVKELSALYQSQYIKAHDGPITTMKFSDDGKYLASGGEDGVLRVWKIEEDNRSRKRDLPKIETDPSCLYFEVDDQDLSRLKPVRVDEEKKTKRKNLRKASESVCVVFPSKVFRIMENPIHEFRFHTGEILDISWSKNNCLLSASMDNTVRLWRIGSNDCLGVFPHNTYVTSVQFNPGHENYFISGSIDGKVRIWEISDCRVADWANTREIISAVCYRPDGRGGIIGSLEGNCRFFNMSGDYIELDSQIHLVNHKKSSNKRITGFKFLPHDPSKVLVVSGDSQVRILHGNNVVRKYKSLCKTRSLTSVSLTSDGKHIVSACEDSNVYIWNSSDNTHEEESDSSSSQMKKIRSFECFLTNASVATTWCGFSSEDKSPRQTPLPPSCLSQGLAMGSGFKGCATWPEENLPSSPFTTFKMNVSPYKTNSLAWGMVIVTGGWDGRIRTFQNYGLPLVT
ncbi:PREDICTED: uncharacterized WD repeat-containing protein C3H5.08c-like [Tarenaya hassleriana]|uniref:uncharacterized WD repeat-containing protein C3H5.08c-like n=1 Tax=Tarenaya hassleriana TaxID=28532 RepID=UPI00053CA420|nr:PREDICTED: uncharacterized WD repeat-containing protein C3H5.08c-like [Tarenaya hassleriana]XP_010537068.1 PREDICTED: uncharacterized WD repeat-containing protein C3H5.08c-like [Tarenaya hassleriana]